MNNLPRWACRTLGRAVAGCVEQGCRVVRAQSGIPGIEKTYGVAAPGMNYEPAEPGLPHDPVCLAAVQHFDLSIHNFGIREYMIRHPDTDRVFPHHYRFEAGFMHPGEARGPGRDK